MRLIQFLFIGLAYFGAHQIAFFFPDSASVISRTIWVAVGSSRGEYFSKEPPAAYSITSKNFSRNYSGPLCGYAGGYEWFSGEETV